MPVNESKIRDFRFWDRWRRAGAIAKPVGQTDRLTEAIRQVVRDVEMRGGNKETISW